MTPTEMRYSVTTISKFIGIAIMICTIGGGLLAIGARIEGMKSGMILQQHEIVQTKQDLADHKTRHMAVAECSRMNEKKVNILETKMDYIVKSVDEIKEEVKK